MLDTKKKRLLKIFEDQGGVPISGEELASRFHVSRNAIWKMVNALRKEGIQIEAKQNTGYYIPKSADYLSAYEIRKKLPDAFKRIPISLFQEIDSTNSEAIRRMASTNCPDQLIISEMQTNGRGHGDNKFISPPQSGIYMTVIYHVASKHFSAKDVTERTAAALVTVLESISDQSFESHAPNDIFCKGKKVCGVLTEGFADLENHEMEIIALGIGINTSVKGLPEDILEKADFVQLGNMKRNELVAKLLVVLYQFLGDIPLDEVKEIYDKHLVETAV